MTRPSISSLLIVLAATLGYSNVYAEDHQVAKKDNAVQKNGDIDFDDAEATEAESFLMVAGGRFKIISKTFTPPNNFTFKSFGNTVGIPPYSPGEHRSCLPL